jgi:nucleoid DNA-binding protein
MVDDKAGLLDAISARSGLLYPQTASAVEIMVALLKATLQRGESGQIVSFGHFTIQPKDPCTGWDVHTCQDVLITPRKVVRLIGSMHLYDLVNREEILPICFDRWRGGHGCVGTLRPCAHVVAHTMNISPHAWGILEL